MTDEQPTPQEDAPLVVSLQLIQPSGTAMSFAGTPAATTLRQLKAKVRDALPSRPPDDHIRFIYRGHLLQRDTDTLLDVFTEQVIRSSGDQQSLHMVVRDAPNHPSGSTPQLATPNRGQSPAPGHAIPPPDNHAQPPFARQQHIQFHPQHGIRVTAAGFIPPPQPMVHHPQHQDMVQWVAHLQREAFQRQAVAQMNAQRHLLGYGIPHLDGVHHAQVGADHQAHPLTRDMVGPNGQQVRITVQNEGPSVAPTTASVLGSGPTSNPGSHRPLSANGLHNIVHGAEAARATQTMTDAMHRSASGASLASMAANLANFNGPVQPIQPGVTTPLYPGVSRHASRPATPDPFARHASYGIPQAQRPTQPQTQPQGPQQGQSQARALEDLEVYILYDQAGPRALLVNSPLELYTIRQPNLPARPQQHVYHPMAFGVPLVAGVPGPAFFPPPFYTQPAMYPPPFQPNPMPFAFQQPPPVQVPAAYQPQPDVAVQVQPQQGQAQAGFQPHPVDGLRHRGQQDQVVPPANPPLARPPQFGHHGNPGGWVVGAWPTVWLLIRLAAFAFWFSYSNPSWERWLSLGIASLILLAFHTGILNTLVNEVFQPIRQHIENLIPNPDAQNLERPAQNAPAGAGQAGNPDPNPADTARRLVAQRRNANGNWLQNQARWLERAGILLLASLAPGVAERHIQQLEAREREERRAAEEAAERERAAAQAAQEAQEADSAQGTQTEGQQRSQEDGAGQEQQGERQAEHPLQPQPQVPLVEV
ncbi:hypothetical protein QBC40DRAFT_201808 [Triangularia verruculosa]|uniref:Ubiquitin-like domain-containing protein n=1 Tax=Triangularia verruculosa TaxID=2587418 RepID=A0AAN7ASW6_9PEZI|nr:hypothetical protein QBC40DRAFT_201808 [Triangularia verruculosa]